MALNAREYHCEEDGQAYGEAVTVVWGKCKQDDEPMVSALNVPNQDIWLSVRGREMKKQITEVMTWKPVSTLLGTQKSQWSCVPQTV